MMFWKSVFLTVSSFHGRQNGRRIKTVVVVNMVFMCLLLAVAAQLFAALCCDLREVSDCADPQIIHQRRDTQTTHIFRGAWLPVRHGGFWKNFLFYVPFAALFAPGNLDIAFALVCFSPSVFGCCLWSTL